MSNAKNKALTYRVENIPWGTTPDELIEHYFFVDDQEHLKVCSLVPSVDSPEGEEEDGDLTATVLFKPPVPQPDGPRIQHTIQIDKKFTGFTPLYVPPPEKGPIVADIIAVTGLAGHAYGSWAHSDEKMWLRDYLKTSAANARIITYGYESGLQNSTSFGILQDHAHKFCHALDIMREQAKCESRPIIFIGHSLGCLIIKKAMTDAASLGIDLFRLPVLAIIFLAAPHRGLDVSALQTLVKGQPPRQIIDELAPGSSLLLDLNTRFPQIAQDIDILSCYETKQTKTAVEMEDGTWARNGKPVTMVTRDSALLFYPREISISADADHSEISKISRGQGGILTNIRSTIQRALRLKSKRVGSHPESEMQEKKDSTWVQGKSREKFELRPKVVPQSEEQGAPAHSSAHRDLGPSPTPQMQPVDAKAKNEAATELVLASCVKCDNPIPDSDRHYLCQDCQRPAFRDIDDFPWHCYDCSRRAGFECHLHDKKEWPQTILRGSSGAWRVAQYLEEQVSPGELAINKAIKTNDTKGLERLLRERRDLPTSEVTGNALYLTTQLGRADCARILLSRSVGMEFRIWTGWTPLMSAIEYDNLDTARVLIEYQVDINESGPGDQGTALAKAVKHGLRDAVEFLLRHGASAEVDREIPVLYLAARLGDTNILGMLLKATDGRVNVVDQKSGNTPLHAASAEGHEIVRILLKHGAHVNALNATNKSALYSCALFGHANTTRTLLAAGADINFVESDGGSLLHVAVSYGHLEVCRILINHKPNLLESKDKDSRTPLIAAVEYNRSASVEFLLSKGADINAVYSDGMTPLHVAAQNGSLEISRLIVNHDASLKLLNSQDDSGRTPLMVAMESEKLPVVEKCVVIEYLLSKGANVDLPDFDGWTPLHIAARAGALDICRLLVKYHAKLDLQTVSETTALAEAVENNHSAVVEMLLDCRPAPDPDARHLTNYTCLHMAARNGNYRICLALLDRSASPDELALRDGIYSTPLSLAIRRNDPEIVRLLIERGASMECHEDPRLQTVCGVHCPRISAAVAGFVECLEVILELSADINYECPGSVAPYGGSNALAVAAHFGEVDAVKYLLDKGASPKPPSRLYGGWKNFEFDSSAMEEAVDLIDLLEKAERRRIRNSRRAEVQVQYVHDTPTAPGRRRAVWDIPTIEVPWEK